MSENTSMENQEIPAKVPGEQEETFAAEDDDKEPSGETGFFGKLINNLKSLLS